MYRIFFIHDYCEYIICSPEKSDSFPLYQVISLKEVLNTLKLLMGTDHGNNKYKIISTDFKATFKKFKKKFHIVQAAGGIVFSPTNDILCILRYGKWDLPKGKIEDAETKTQAALREVQEETGAQNLVLTKKITTTYHIYFQKYRWILKPTHWYLMQTSSKILTPQLKEGITEAVWMSPQDLQNKMIINTYPCIKQLINNLSL